MAHNPNTVSPEHPEDHPLAQSSPEDSQSPRPESAPAPIDPEVALQESLAAAQKTEKVANRIPDIKKSAYILLGLILFSAAQSLAMEGVIVSMLGSQQHNSTFLISNIFSWSVGALCALILLTTKSTKLAKRVLLVIGLALLYFTLTDLMVVNIIGMAIDGFLLGWTYRLYQSVSTLEL